MRKFAFILCLLLIGGAVFADAYNDVAPYLGPVAYYPPATDATWDVLFWTDAQTTTNSNLLLGAEYAGGHFIVTGGGTSSATTTDNKLYLINNDGTLFQTFDQPNNSGWGWRDPAFDGTYLYFGCETTTILAYTPQGVPAPSFDIPKPAVLAVARALAYDPNTDHFFSGNFGNNMVEFDRSGNVIWQGSPSPLAAVYGMCYDDVTGHIWIYDQGSSQCVFHEWNQVTHTFTGVSHIMPLIGSSTSQIAGGCGFTNEWNPSFWTIVAMLQGTPNDLLYVVEMWPAGPLPNITINMTPINPPIVIPAGGGSFNFNATITNNETSSQTFGVWIMVTLPNGSQFGPVLGPVTLTVPAGASITRQRTQVVPASAPAGNYTYTGNVGSYPSTVYNSSSFPFSKSTLDNGSFEGEWANYGESFEVGAAASAPVEFALLGNYPNPFNPSTIIRYTLDSSSEVNLTVYDLSGRAVADLVNGYRDAGSHEVTFDASGLASGVYIYRLTSGSQTAVGKMMLMK